MSGLQRGHHSSPLDGISCVAYLLIATFLLFTAGMLAQSLGAEGETGGTLKATSRLAGQPGSATATLALAEQDDTLVLPTFTAVPLVSPTALPSPLLVVPTATPGPTLSPSPVPTQGPTATPTMQILPTPIGGYTQTVRVPILMYHYVSVPPEEADEYRTDLSVSPTEFRAQMQYLADNGFTTVDLYDLSLAVTARRSLPPKPVILTFDDGYLDHYTDAFPIMEEFGFKGTFFIITEYVDAGNPNHLTWPMIEEMAAAGHRMESHSKTHPDLRDASEDTLIWEILGSQQTLEAHIGYTPRFFCYPGGRYDENTIAMLEELDFWGAVTTAGGKWHTFEGRYEWLRLRIRYTTNIAEFADLVEPGA